MRPAPSPAPGEVLIRVQAAGVNRPDVLQREGKYAPPPGANPVLGLEVAGVVAAVGAEAQGWQVGDRVCALTNGGGYAEYCAAPAGQCLPWPAGYKASAQAYELVALELTWTPSKDYTIPIRKQDFAINTGSQFPNTPDPIVNDAIKAAGYVLLPDQVDKGDPVTGWLVFKVDPRNAAKLTLDYTRPAVQISGSRTSFPAKTFSVGIVG